MHFINSQCSVHFSRSWCNSFRNTFYECFCNYCHVKIKKRIIIPCKKAITVKSIGNRLPNCSFVFRIKTNGQLNRLKLNFPMATFSTILEFGETVKEVSHKAIVVVIKKFFCSCIADVKSRRCALEATLVHF